ncbi:hypothetical protein FRC04_010349 [Tulasnella sp. 424]|nr:hypothetical protein FRC04_010349 [Tulasnella sp. 424]KAG8978713.1 hypothetical protein FRC05_009986 [Tulasnella sp. 425]
MYSLPPEIQIAIFEQLYKKDLVSSALVCRAWRQVAWDYVRWQSCTIRITGLLQVLIGENSSESIDERDIKPSTSDSNRFLGLAAKVISIRLDKTLANSLARVLLEIASSAPAKVLFPALSTLDCGGRPQDDLVYNLFTGSPIKRIWISGVERGKTTSDSRRLLSSLLATQSQVQFVTADEMTLPGLGSPEFWQLPELVSFEYKGHFAPDNWAEIIQKCPKLESVTLKGTPLGSNPPTLPSSSAPALRWLDMEFFESFELTILILESTSMPRLTTLVLDLRHETRLDAVEHPWAPRARSAFRLLAERSQRLESLALDTSVRLGVEILGAFRTLRTLNIVDRTAGCQLDDRDVESLCRSLPSLKIFHLEYKLSEYFAGENNAKITPRSLGCFARHCTDLEYLGLPISATDPEDFVGPILAELVPFRGTLEHLALTPITLDSKRAEYFVSFLLIQCPKLTRLDVDIDMPDFWTTVYMSSWVEQEMRDTYFNRQSAQ